MADTMASMPSRKGKPIPPLYIAGGAGAVFVLYYLYSSSKKKAAATAAATPMAAATSAATTPVVPAGSYGQDNSNALNNVAQQLASLQASQAATQGAAAQSGIATPYASPTGETLIQPLYAPGNTASYGYPGNTSQLVTGADGHTYQAVSYSGKPGEQSGQQLAAQGIPQYYQPLPGVFSPSSGNSALTYVRVS